MRHRFLAYGSLIMVVVLAAVLQVTAQVEEPPTSIAMIIDASGSMQALIESSRSRIAVAKEEIIALSSELDPNVDASLWVYGHRLSQADPAASCLDIEQIIPPGPPDVEAFTATVTGITAIGYTPLAMSLGMAYSSLPVDGRSIIVLMSDGEESCGGDPCAVAAELDARNIELRIHTIGFAADAGTRAQLQCIAEVTGGNYYEAQDTAGLRQALRAATAPVTGTIAIVRSDGEVATGISFTVVDSAGETSGSVISTGSFEPGDYSVIVNTEPPFEASVTVIAGETATVVLPDLGLIRVVDASGDVLDQFPLTAYAASTDRIIGSGAAGIMELPPGSYDVTIGNATDQRHSVTLTAGETVDIQIDFGALQLVDADGLPTDSYPFYVFSEGSVEVVAFASTGTANLFPGTYDVEVRANPHLRQTVTIAAGETTDIMLPGIGTLQIVDSTGAPVGDYTFTAYPEGGDGQMMSARSGEIDLLAGAYEVEVQTNPPLRQPVTITAGETTQITLPGSGSIQLLDADGSPTGDYAFYVYPAGGDRMIAGSVTGAMTIAEGTYDVDVYTNPRAQQTVTVVAGEITTIQLGGMGTIQIVDSDGSPNNDYAFYVSPQGGNQIVATGFGSAEVAAGTYEVQVYTNPITRQTVTVSSGATVEVAQPPIGTIQMIDAAGNPVTDPQLYVYEADGNQIVATGFGSLNLAAGTYEAVISTSPATHETITISGGETTEVSLPPLGTLESVDATGSQTREDGFWVYPKGSDEYAAYVTSGSVVLIAGDYEVSFDSDLSTRYPVTVAANEITNISVP